MNGRTTQDMSQAIHRKDVERGSMAAMVIALLATTCFAQEEPANSAIASIQGGYDAQQVVVDVGFRATPDFATTWDFQLFIDADNDVTTGYARGFDLLVRGVGPLTSTVAVYHTTGGGGPAGWGPLAAKASAAMLDPQHLRISLPFGTSGLTQGAVRYTFEVYNGGVLIGTARDRSTEPSDGHVATDCNLNGVSDDRDIANGASLDCSGNGIPDECEPDCNSNAIADSCEIAKEPSLDCDQDGVLGSCESFARAQGSRYITIKPTDGAAPVALLIRGDPENGAVACVSRYVQRDGSLAATAHFATPNDWCKVHAIGGEILPGHTYRVYEVHGTSGTPSLSNETIVTMWQRGDTNRDGDVSFVDIARVVDGFIGAYSASLTLEMVDLISDNNTLCHPDRVVSFKDISEAVSAFAATEPTAVCPAPCR